MENLNNRISSDDLWTIFTTCPIERGKIDVYCEYVKAKEREKIVQSNKNKEVEMEL